MKYFYLFLICCASVVKAKEDQSLCSTFTDLACVPIKFRLEKLSSLNNNETQARFSINFNEHIFPFNYSRSIVFRQNVLCGLDGKNVSTMYLEFDNIKTIWNFEIRSKNSSSIYASIMLRRSIMLGACLKIPSVSLVNETIDLILEFNVEEFYKCNFSKYALNSLQPPQKYNGYLLYTQTVVPLFDQLSKYFNKYCSLGAVLNNKLDEATWNILRYLWVIFFLCGFLFLLSSYGKSLIKVVTKYKNRNRVTTLS